MKRLTRALLAATLSLCLAGSALAETTDETTSTSVFAPDSPLFFVQRAFDAWEELFAFDPLVRAQVHSKLAVNRFAEARVMMDANKDELAARLSEEAAEHVAKAAAALAQAKAEADDARASGHEDRADARQEAVEDVLAQLAENADRVQESLEAALENVENETAQEAIAEAIELAASGLETAAQSVSGDYTTTPVDIQMPATRRAVPGRR